MRKEEPIGPGLPDLETAPPEIKKKKKASRVILNIAIVIAAGVLAFALYNLYGIWKEYNVAEQEYEDIAREFDGAAGRSELESDPGGFGNNEAIRALLEKYAAANPDFVGIIYIPGTNIFYPMVQGEDNDYYLTHTFDGTYNSSGAIFLERGAARDFSYPNTIIYGHNMHNGTMFENLNLLLDAETLAEHHTAYIVTLDEVRVYEIFAAKQVTVEHELYTTYFETPAALQKWLDAVAPGRGLSADDDSVITLSTCTYEVESINRVVAQGFLAEVIRLGEWNAEDDEELAGGLAEADFEPEDNAPELAEAAG